MSELLRIENLSFSYGGLEPVLKNISTVFHTGEKVAVLGGNGAGKSTFFLCCNAVLRPQHGKLFYKDREISTSKKDKQLLRQSVGLVFQDADSQIIAGSVESEISFGPMNLSLPRDEVKRRVEQAMAQMNISEYRDYTPHYLSGGEKKRVSIADILAMQPEILLLDEPTASLDPQNEDALEQILDELNRTGITIVISTHDVNFAYKIAQRAIVFAKGEIIADADIDEVFARSEILERAGLKKPLLYEAFEQLYPEETNRKPRNIKEFKDIISARRIL